MNIKCSEKDYVVNYIIKTIKLKTDVNGKVDAEDLIKTIKELFIELPIEKLEGAKE